MQHAHLAGTLGVLLLCLNHGRANLLLNPSFESSPHGQNWTLDLYAEVWHNLNDNPRNVYVGTHALALRTTPTAATVRAQQILNTVPHATWTYSGYMLNSVHHELSSGCYGLAQIEFLAGDNSPLAEVKTDKMVQLTGPWTPFSISGEAPDGTAKVVFRSILMQGNNPSGVLFVDGLDATMVAPVPEVGLLGSTIVVVGLALLRNLRTPA